MTYSFLRKCLFSVVAMSSLSAAAADYEWNYPAPVKVPAPANSNNKTVLFDVSHGGTEGNADWVINGGFSDFADSLVNVGYRVEEYRGVDKNNDGIIQFVDDYTNPTLAATAANEAIIAYSAISHADVLVLAETNRPFTQDELTALEQFIAAGKGIYFIADHYNADRNLNSWDATEVFNGYNRSNLNQFNVGGSYGDLRNPASANAGWLVDNFGIRFRFNAVNWLTGASGIVSSSQGEGITQNVTPVLMAAGATLAIVDPSRAKGLVYFSNSDSPSAWGNAVDSGLYFGGEAEGPYVAIAKSGAGKAAFIGDSSPVEDNSPRYKRQDSGGTKNTYPGWTDTGNAAQLSVNIIHWLATPESYTQFNSSEHPAGTATPNPMATQELTDPDNGEPWSTPNGSYNPWNPATFAYAAYGAASGFGSNSSTSTSSSASSSSSGSGNTSANSIASVLAQPVGTAVSVVGKITQAINGIYALEIADENNASATIYIKLDSQYRSEFSPQNHPEIIGATLKVTGVRDEYMSSPSVEYVTDMQFVTALNVTEALAESMGSEVTARGVVTQAINGVYALEMADENNASSTIYVKLESQYRNDFSPQNNPALLGAVIDVTGIRDMYMSEPSIEYVTAITVVSSASSSSSSSASCGTSGAVSVAVANAASVGQNLEVVGEVVAAINGQYALELADLTSNTTVYVKLESSQRSYFSPQNNPTILGAVVQVTGTRDVYMSYPSVEYVTDIQELAGCH